MRKPNLGSLRILIALTRTRDMRASKILSTRIREEINIEYNENRDKINLIAIYHDNQLIIRENT